MAAPHRYIGVAKVPPGHSMAPPRGVVDLTGGRHVSVPPLQMGALPHIGTPEQPAAFRGPDAVAVGTAPYPLVPPRPPQPQGGAGGGVRGRTLRRIEIGSWLAALGVLVALAAYLVVQPTQAARWVATPPAGAGDSDPAVAPVVPGYATASPAACAFDSCAPPGPQGEPTRVRIAKIDVETPLEQLSLDARNHLTTPRDYARAGWFAKGPVPGDAGAAVIAGHVDSTAGAAVFFRLHTLRAGDVIEVQRGGVWLRFQVTEVEQYPKNQFPTSKVYRPTPDAQLRVITCGGDFDESRLTYRDNIVVYATAVDGTTSR